MNIIKNAAEIAATVDSIAVTANINSDHLNTALRSVEKFTLRAPDVRGNQHTFVRMEIRNSAQSATLTAVDGYRCGAEEIRCKTDGDAVCYIQPGTKFPRGVVVQVTAYGDRTVYSFSGAEITVQSPDGEFLDVEETIFDAAHRGERVKIGVNPDYLIAAAKAAKESRKLIDGRGKAHLPIVLEFGSPIEPILIYTPRGGKKMVLPVRLKNID